MKTATSGNWLSASPSVGNRIASLGLICHAVRGEFLRMRIVFPDGAST
jgi:hypothetical protein